MNGRSYRLIRSTRLGPAAARAVAAAINRRPLGHEVGAMFDCPADFARDEIIVLSYRGQPDTDLWVSPTGCASVANGYAMIMRI